MYLAEVFYRFRQSLSPTTVGRETTIVVTTIVFRSLNDRVTSFDTLFLNCQSIPSIDIEILILNGVLATSF